MLREYGRPRKHLPQGFLLESCQPATPKIIDYTFLAWNAEDNPSRFMITISDGQVLSVEVYAPVPTSVIESALRYIQRNENERDMILEHTEQKKMNVDVS